MSNLTNTVYEQILTFQAPWGSAFSLLEMEGWFNIQQMYDCVGVFAAGLDNLLKRNLSFTPEMLASRQLNRLMNRTLFADTGYRGMLGDPVGLQRMGIWLHRGISAALMD
ncbi:hypothetical protein BCR33DRAFT_131944 [Rhizoclosmatium globosum]|uniref:Uncharacterized protein n=1 Tax=Rhizoclosmatium globosum TaxID=329046 RepID=A0A1Y2CIF0_9FUNG|nr:hypothetical protein BCR33DRAFT_131944 [Rhizoclosmatium globosum]|eukprot:ORY46604.1 hypothetical protein BCR33DRAFT_131944 [Rhizoclosmatium globosum]